MQKRYEKQFKSYLKLGIFLFGISLLFVNCDKDDSLLIQEKTVQRPIAKRISFDEFKLKNTPKTIDFISPVLDLKRKQTAINNRDIHSIDSSFTISTDEIIEVITDSTASYTFNITTKLKASHDSEQFLIQQVNDAYHYSILGFTYDDTLISTGFPYSVETLEVGTDLIDMTEFLNSMMSAYIFWSDGCLWNYSYLESCDCEVLSLIGCETGGGDGSGSSGGGSSSSESDSSGSGSGTGGVGGDSGGISGGGSTTGNGTTNNTQDNDMITQAPIGVNLPINKDNCSLFKKLANDQAMKDLINYYKTQTGQPYEQGVALTAQPNGTYSAIQGVVPPDDHAIAFDFPITTTPLQINYIVHTHVPGGLSIFSPKDTKLPYLLSENPNVTISDTFISIVVTTNSVYAFSFQNFNTYSNFASLWLANGIVFAGYDQTCTDKKEEKGGYGINLDNNIATNEYNFLAMLQHRNTGVLIHKANSTLTEWSRLKINPFTNNVDEVPCN